MTNQEFFDKIIEYHKYCSGDPDLLEGRLGIEPLECDIEAQTADYIYNAVRWHRNDYLGVHGGTIAAVFDYTMALTLGGQGVGPIGTVNMSLQYLRPAMGDKFRVHTET
ncbi:MAG: hypothetical protein HUJ78_04040, partial [Mogibacterium sp.]|nr:hypothetical protein [Mogibacterium sp.]